MLYYFCQTSQQMPNFIYVAEKCQNPDNPNSQPNKAEKSSTSKPVIQNSHSSHTLKPALVTSPREGHVGGVKMAASPKPSVSFGRSEIIPSACSSQSSEDASASLDESEPFSKPTEDTSSYDGQCSVTPTAIKSNMKKDVSIIDIDSMLQETHL